MSNRIDLVAGQNCPLSTSSLHVLINHGPLPQGMELDVSAFLLNAQGKVSKDEDFIFFWTEETDSKNFLMWSPSCRILAAKR